MKTELKDQLKNLVEWEFQELRHAMNIAHNIRTMKKDFMLDDKDLMELLELPKKDIVALQDGTHPYDIRTISKVEALSADLRHQKLLEENKLVNIRADED